MPEDQRICAGVLRNEELCVTVIAVKSLSVCQMRYGSAEKEASHRAELQRVRLRCTSGEQSTAARPEPIF